ncbi:phage late control D family protein [Paenibacillus sp. GbtcB18]|uniref:phage late control D family protein n=1 Tax=Paenibacillus sp. GbtcB18 TaxID=2824763 RepID=UPI001C30B04B|nr:contractile injection system protein, VgrG/Pvc8 family [Paenibacillus sp. GbtcB18]
MNDIQDARRAELVITYNGKNISRELAESLTDFSYNDAAPGSLDDLQISLEDRGRKWQKDWSPAEGDRIKAEIKVTNWGKAGEIKRLPCGTFEVDSIDFDGPPDKVSIKAVSLPIDSEARQEKRSKAWEKVTLKTIAADIAKRAKLKLKYEVKENPKYDRLDQASQSDLAFLNDTAIKEGIALKITAGQLVLFDEREFERKAPVLSIIRNQSDVTGYKFAWSTAYAAYRACEVSYTTSKSKKTIKAFYSPPGAPKTGPVLKINEQAKSQAEALRAAEKSLREKNKEAGKASLSLAGDIRLAAGVTINIEGWGRFDGKYLIISAGHKIGSGGYSTDIEIRKVLGW